MWLSAYGEAIPIAGKPYYALGWRGGAMTGCESTDVCVHPWYVVHVPTGKEAYMASLIERMSPDGLVHECFTPRYATQVKRAGEWVNVEKVLLPGYVIVVTDNPEDLVRTLRVFPEFARLLTMGESFVPLTVEDRAWIDAFTHEGDRCIAMSEGVLEGDRVVVLRGPLKGNEAIIVSVNRHKSVAFVELDFCGRRVKTKVGLGIVSRRDGEAQSRADRRA